MIEPLKRHANLLIGIGAVFYVALLLALVFTRAAWIDESWFTAYTVHLLRFGEIADLNMARFTNQLPHSFFFYAYTYLQAPFYKLFGENLFVGRFVTLFFALWGAAAIYLTYRRYFQLDQTAAAAGTLTAVSTFYYVVAATHIRPDVISVAFVMTALLTFRRWEEGDGWRWLFLTHFLFLYALLTHLQTAYAWMAFWLYLLIRYAKDPRRLTIFLLSIAPYLLALLYFVLDPFFKENVRIFYETFLGEHNKVSGRSMISSILLKLSEGDYLKAGVRIALLTVFSLNFLGFAARKGWRNAFGDPFFVVALGAFASWVLTVNSIGSYHAVWLAPAFMLMFYNLLGSGAFMRYLNLLMFALFIGATLKFAWHTVTTDPLARQNREVSILTDKYDLKHHTLFVQRDLMWYFHFAPNVTYRRTCADCMPEYLIFRKATHKRKRIYLSGDEPGIRYHGEDVPYRLIDETAHFMLYKRCPQC